MILIIIGAPRSGTNMLRNVLTSFDGISTWPCDEINYIWRYGNASYPSDELPISKVTPKIKDYIRKKFSNIFKQYDAKVIVEKTCANSLRIGFVNKIFPEAKYIYIYRDGIDVVGSAKKRWTADIDFSYLFQKVKYVPKTELPYYALVYFFSRVSRFFSNENRLSFWGPKLKNMDKFLNKYTLPEVCALQWKACVEKAEKSFNKMPKDKVMRIRYEDFVSSPFKEVSRILSFMGKSLDNQEINSAIEDVSKSNIGKGRKVLSEGQIKKIQLLIGKELKYYGYQ